jgi:hypothetical protein
MVETKNHLFIHLQKCAGSHISSLIEQNFDVKAVGDVHGTITPEEKNKTIVGCIRNPLSYYVSLWAYNISQLHGIGKKILRSYEDKGYLFEDSASVSNFQDFLKFLLTDAKLTGTDFCTDTSVMRKYNIGHLTYRFFLLYNCLDFILLKNPKKNLLADVFIRSEKLEEDFNKIFDTDIKKTTNFNKSEHLHYVKYYNTELINLVYEKDMYIFKKFSYEIPTINSLY